MWVLISLFLLSIYDLKTREVPEFASFTLFSLSLLYRLSGDLNFFKVGLYGFIFSFLLGLILYHANLWGGGDSKILFALGWYVGLSWNFFNIITLFLTIFFVGSFYSLIYMMIVLGKSGWLDYLKQHYLSYGVLFSVPLTFLGLYGMIFLLGFLTYFIVTFSMFVDGNHFTKKIPVSQLTEGDWLLSPKKFKNHVFSNCVNLKDLDILKKNFHEVEVKYGVPFLPSFFFAYLLLRLGLDFFLGLLRELGLPLGF